MSDPGAALLNARYIAIRTAEAKGLTDRLREAARDRTPGVRRLLGPMLFRFWYRDRERGWELLELIARDAVRFAGRPDLEKIELIGGVSVAILNASRQQPDDLARLGAIWRSLSDRLLGGPLARGLRLVGRGWLLRRAAGSLANALKKQPRYQPLNYGELSASFARPNDFRLHWQRLLDCLERPETAPGPILSILDQADLPFDLYVMMVSERALIFYCVHADPATALDTVEQVFRTGPRWFGQSILYVLFHVLTAWASVDDAVLDRYEALALEFHRSGRWRIETPCGRYVFANQIGNVDAIVARRGVNRAPHVVADLMSSAITEHDDEQIEALFDAIDCIAFYHGNGALALTLLERAYIAAGPIVEHRVIASLASVRLQDQPLVDAFLQQNRSFARISTEDVAAAQPSVGGEDFNTLIDQFVIQSMLSSDDFRAQLCRAFTRALEVRNVEQFLVQILEWFRDELGRLPAPATP